MQIIENTAATWYNFSMDTIRVKTYAKIKKISYKVISVKNQETLSSKSVEGKKFTKKLDDPSKAGTLMAEYIAREAYKVILKDKGY